MSSKSRQKKPKRPDVVMVRDLGKIAEQLRARGLFRCHVLVPDCKREPYAEVNRKSQGLRGLFCREHARHYAEQEGIPFPEPEDD